jgi:aminodeoxyfutalosine synthase
MDELTNSLISITTDASLKAIALKVLRAERIAIDEALLLGTKAPLGLLAGLADAVKMRMYGKKVFFNKNFHIEPTNICVYDCKFCSYSRLVRQKEEGWEIFEEDILKIVRSYDGKPVTEVHIVGGVHPKMGLEYFGNILSEIKKIRPELHIKAFTAVELYYMFKKAGKTYSEGLEYLKHCGLNSIPGGGAEIFDAEIRKRICEDKCTSEEWLEIHKTAHLLGIPSNATMLYGHYETWEHRIDHMNRLRILQDETKGFNTFIPLKFRNKDNQMSDVPECTTMEDMRVYALARVFLDNFPHLKSYWPMLGRDNAALSLGFGVDDIDGTIDDSTKIYSMAGSQEQSPVMTTSEIVALIRNAGKIPVERDTLYKELAVFDADSALA